MTSYLTPEARNKCTKCFECGKKISKGVELGSNRGGRREIYLPSSNYFCTRKCLIRCVKRHIENFDMRDW